MAREITYISNSALNSALNRYDDEKNLSKSTKALLARVTPLSELRSSSAASIEGMRELANLPATSTRDEIEEAFNSNRVPLLTRDEQNGAKLIFETLGPVTEFSAQLPRYQPEIKYGEREEVLKVDDAIAILKAKGVVGFSGTLTFPAQFTITPDRKVKEVWPSQYYSINAEEVLKRIAGTVPNSDDGDINDLTPVMLKTYSPIGDPFKSDGLNEIAKNRLTGIEKMAAAFMYAHLFVPSATLPPVEQSKQQIAEIKDSAGSVIATCSIEYEQGVFAGSDAINKYVRPTRLVIDGVEGTELLLGHGDGVTSAASLNNGQFVLALDANSERELTAVILNDPDGMGVLQPKVVDRIAVKTPAGIQERI